jgi:hypothetical protein
MLDIAASGVGHYHEHFVIDIGFMAFHPLVWRRHGTIRSSVHETAGSNRSIPFLEGNLGDYSTFSILIWCGRRQAIKEISPISSVYTGNMMEHRSM